MTPTSDKMTFKNAAMGLSRDEWDLITQRLDRVPNLANLAYFPQCGPNIAHTNHQKNG